MLESKILELIVKASTELPRDVMVALSKTAKRESRSSAAKGILECLLENCRVAREERVPLCQDTGAPVFYVSCPQGQDTRALETAIKKAAVAATRRGFLRPNAVDPLTGKNSGNNTGAGFPVIHFRHWSKKALRFDLILKGGGSENVSAQYSLPDERLRAGRDFDGVIKCVMDAALNAQGKGCPPGIVAVGIGGDRENSYRIAREQLLRKLDDRNPEPRLAKLEESLLRRLNMLGIGPMGLGGKTTALGVKAACLHRHTACFFVCVSYMCWAFRRRSLTVKGKKAFYD